MFCKYRQPQLSGVTFAGTHTAVTERPLFGLHDQLSLAVTVSPHPPHNHSPEMKISCILRQKEALVHSAPCIRIYL